MPNSQFTALRAEGGEEKLAGEAGGAPMDDGDQRRNWAGCCFNGSPNPSFRLGGPHPDKAVE